MAWSVFLSDTELGRRGGGVAGEGKWAVWCADIRVAGELGGFGDRLRIGTRQSECWELVPCCCERT